MVGGEKRVSSARLLREVLWRLAYAGAIRTTQIANAPGGEIFARRGAMDTASRDFNHC